ncbi:MAG: FAD-binding protein [Acidimicrobiales bacterium]
MADIIVVGGGVAGLCGGLLLARDGHRVRILERDPTPPPGSPDETWTGWERRGVNQFRLLHYFLPRFRQILETELPDLVAALESDGAVRSNAVTLLPTSLRGDTRPEDERFTAITGRRPMVEAAIARVAAAEPGLQIVRGTAVQGLRTAATAAVPAVPHVTGVVTADDELDADLVVDASGRRSPLSRWLVALGARPPQETKDDCGFIYYGRHFRSPDGRTPQAMCLPLQPYDSVSFLMLPADNGTWGVGLITSAADPVLRSARHPAVWERIVKSYPLVAHWLDGEPISGIDVMAKIEDHHRRFWSDGTPVATGVLPLGDAWSCTNPSVGRGASIGLLHAVCLRDLLREVPTRDPLTLATRWDEITTEVVEPLFEDTLAFDRHRLAEIDAQIAGVPYVTEDPAWQLTQALRRSAFRDPDLLRAYASVASLLDRGIDVMSQPGIAERAIALGTNEPAPGSTRAELVAIASA